MSGEGLRPLTLAEARAVRDTEGVGALRDLVCERVEEARENAVIAIHADVPVMPDGPLHGLPFGVKDNIDCRGFPTSGGSSALTGFEPRTSAPAVAALERRGGWVPIKCNLHELAFGVTSNNAAFGAVRNPFAHDRVAGGSSGGNAAAIARGIVPFALGTDTGGSTRIPAAFCGIVGFRPSTGRYPTGGVLTLSTTRDTIGPMASCVADVAEVDALAVPGGARHDGGTVAQSLRIGRLQVHQGLSDAVDTAVEEAFEALARTRGVDVVAVVEPAFDDLDERFGNAVVLAEAATFWRSFCEDHLDRSFTDFGAAIASPDVRHLFEILSHLGDDVIEVRRRALEVDIPALRAVHRSLFERHELDLLVMPAVCVPPPRVGDEEVILTGRGVRPTFATLTQNMALAALVGGPSLTLPAGVDRDGLPVSLMVEGLPWSDRAVLRAGLMLEEVLSPSGRHREP